MDRNRITGALRQATGSVKEVVGKATGNKKMQAQGRIEKAAGKTQSAVGGVKDAVRKSTED